MDNQEIISIVLNVLSLVGGSSLAAALLPLKYRKYLPWLIKIIDFLGANFGSAENKEPELIEVERQKRKFKKPHKR